MEEKPKRKYTRKPKEPMLEEIEEIEKLLPPTPANSPEIEEDLSKFFVRSYSKTHVYMYYDGDDCYIHGYIKNMQEYLDLYNIGSMVVVNSNFVNNIVLNNCYKMEKTGLNKWTDLISNGPGETCCVKFNKLPMYPVTMLFEHLKKGIYSDKYVEIMEY